MVWGCNGMSTEHAKKRILIVDDDERVLMALECLLEADGFETTTAWSGREGLSLLSTNDFDLVLLDDHLWDIENEEILNEIRELKTVPLVMLTETVPEPETAKRYAHLGVRGYVSKWDSCDKIAGTLQNHLSRAMFEETAA